ncbi:hypothetical protein [Accumulibacter sp.]|uniref:hypothetical protein n=1 Tax=Accumulibacter sp. TaxID=2053492 RepID=UPI0025FC95D8|nr:hypothetical protein [Accumulibacter sp.]MCM8625366.1 hypothetical protein [Accumulibacter sp.]
MMLLPVRRELLATIEEQAMVASLLAKIVGEILQGRESAHSMRLVDLDQRREDLHRRGMATVVSIFGGRVGADEVHHTLETLDRVAARLFRTARGVHLLASDTDEACRSMLEVIQRATERLLQGYTRLAYGSLAAELDAEVAIRSRDVLEAGRVGNSTAVQAPPAEGCADDGTCAVAGVADPARSRRIDELYANLSDISHELAGAGTILKRWVRQLSGSAHDSATGSLRCSLFDQGVVVI